MAKVWEGLSMLMIPSELSRMFVASSWLPSGVSAIPRNCDCVPRTAGLNGVSHCFEASENTSM
jgi:hypothetical protein